MIARQDLALLESLLGTFPVVALLGPRQVGKTTLALALAERLQKRAAYLDLELPSDRATLQEPELHLGRQAGRLTILDEVQRVPELFAVLRALVDRRVRAGERAGHFLVLGSASPDLLSQSSESLAGRIAYHELKPFSLLEVEGSGRSRLERLWLRGGFPLSFLAEDDRLSGVWREHFTATYLEREIAQIAPRMSSELVRRAWTMLALGQGTLWNASRLAANLGISGVTARRYLDVLSDLFLVRQLQPWSGNSAKRLVKSPKVYVRDSGLLHRLVAITDMEMLLSHPIVGASWEGFAIEQILAHADRDWRPSFYRTAAGAEIDLVLEHPDGRTLAVEVKRTSTPTPGRGYLAGVADIDASERWFVVPEGDARPIGAGTEAIGLREFASRLART